MDLAPHQTVESQVRPRVGGGSGRMDGGLRLFAAGDRVAGEFGSGGLIDGDDLGRVRVERPGLVRPGRPA